MNNQQPTPQLQHQYVMQYYPNPMPNDDDQTQFITPSQPQPQPQFVIPQQQPMSNHPNVMITTEPEPAAYEANQDPQWIQKLPSSRATPILSEKNLRSLLNQFTTTLLLMAALLLVYYIRGVDTPPIYITALALVGFLLGLIGQIVHSRVCLGLYMICASVAFAYASIIVVMRVFRLDSLVGAAWVLLLFSLINSGKIFLVLYRKPRSIQRETDEV